MAWGYMAFSKEEFGSVAKCPGDPSLIITLTTTVLRTLREHGHVT